MMEAEKKELENLLRVMQATTKSGAVTLLTTEAIKPILRDGVPITYNEYHVLGEGSQGTVVFKGTFGNHPVAVKRMHLDTVKEKAIIKEIETLKTCDLHENIVQYFSTQIVQQHVLIALELCDTTLKRWVANKRSIDISSIEVLRQMTVGLGFLHNRYIIHRDLKPENILLCSQTQKVKISDFGLSRKATGENNYVRTCGAGTLGWVAAEILKQIESENIDVYKFTFASDLFALGCVYYYVLSNGQHAFGNAVRRSANILDGKDEIDAKSLLGVCAQTVKLLHLMVAKNPKLRPSCSDLITCPSFWTPEHRHLFLEQLKAQGEAAMEEVIHFKTTEHCPFDHDLDMQALNTLGNNKVEKVAGCAIYSAYLESVKLGNTMRKPTATISPSFINKEAHVSVKPECQQARYENGRLDNVRNVQLGMDAAVRESENRPPTNINLTVHHISILNNTVEETAIITQHNKVYNKKDMTEQAMENLLQMEPSHRKNNKLDIKTKTFNLLKNKYCWVSLACFVAVVFAISVGSAVLISKQTDTFDKGTSSTTNDDDAPTKNPPITSKSLWHNRIMEIISELTKMTDFLKISKLFDIVKFENLVVIKAVLEDENVTKDLVVTDIRNGTQTSLLHVAVQYRDYAVVEYLMRNQAFSSVLSNPTFNNSALIYDCIKDIHEVSEVRFEEKTHILQLLFKTRPELIEQKLASFYWSWTPLHYTTWLKFQNGKKLEFIKFLIENNANVNSRNIHGNTPLHLTVLKKPLKSDTVDIIKLLIENKADPDATNNKGEPFLYYAVGGCKSPNICNQIVMNLAFINRTKSFSYTNSNETTVLHVSVFYFEPLDETLQLFKSNGVDFNAVDKNGKSALAYATQGGRTAEFLSSLMRYGVDWKINAKNDDTVLHTAAYFGNIPAIKLFVELGSDINAITRVKAAAYPYSVLALAITGGQNESVFNILIESGANWKIMNEKNDTALHFAASNAKLNALKSFILKGCDVNVINTDGYTALHKVFLGKGVDSNAYELVRELVNHGADVNIKDKSGETAIDFAKEKINDAHLKKRIVNLLENLEEETDTYFRMRTTTTTGLSIQLIF